MKTGVVKKNLDNTVSEQDLKLINQYTRKELSAEQVYVFSVVLCDNDIDRDYERFTVESLFELQKLFVGKTGIFDHDPSAKKQTARIFECKVEAIESKKTATGDDYFRLVAKAYIPKCEKNEDIILSLDSGITKEVSVGCAVKQNLCSICSQEINGMSCNHIKGHTYQGKLCYSELVSPYDAYEFSFVAIPAQKNAGVIKNFSTSKEENINMKDILASLKKGEKLELKSYQTKSLCDYIAQLKEQAKDGVMYKEQLKKSVLKAMGTAQLEVSTDTLKSIVSKLSVEELVALRDGYEKKEALSQPMSVQLHCEKSSENKNENISKNNQFTI